MSKRARKNKTARESSADIARLISWFDAAIDHTEMLRLGFARQAATDLFPENPNIVLAGALARGDDETVSNLSFLFGDDESKWPGITFDQAVHLQVLVDLIKEQDRVATGVQPRPLRVRPPTPLPGPKPRKDRAAPRRPDRP